MTAQTGPACLAFHGWYGPVENEPACPAFDDGSFEEAVDELIETIWDQSADIGRASLVAIGKAIKTVESLLSERESRKGEEEK